MRVRFVLAAVGVVVFWTAVAAAAEPPRKFVLDIVLPAPAAPSVYEHPKVAAALANLQGSLLARQRAYGGWAPEISGSIEYGKSYLRDTINSVKDPQQLGPKVTSAINLTQPIYRAFGLADELTLADIGIAAKQAAFDRAVAEVTAEAASVANARWVAARTFTKRQEFEAATVATADAVRAKAKAKAQGAAELPRALERIARAKAAVVEAMSTVEEARAAYVKLWGIQPVAVHEPEVRPACSALAACLEAAGITPVMREQLAAERVAELKVARIALSRRPKADLVGSVSRTDLVYPLPSGRDNASVTDEAFIGAKVVIPAPWGLEADADHTQALRELDAARATRVVTGRAVQGVVTEMWTRVASARLRVTAVKAQVAASKVALTAIDETYRAGDLSIRDVLDGQEAVTAAQVALIKARGDEVEAVVRLNGVVSWIERGADAGFATAL